ncbi:MAG: DUF1385 domain-containing protein [Lachnospira sp.]
MKLSGIGGQAVIEGIMMRNQDRYSIAVRKPDQEIEVIVRERKPVQEKHTWLKAPIIRGIVSFIDSLVVGISTITYSSSFYDDPAEQEKTKFDEVGRNIFKDKFESILMAVTVILSIFLAVGLFMVLPYGLAKLVSKYIASKTLLNFIEGIIRLLIFLLYLVLISRMKDIRRTYMYHGAEHKCINCIENGARLTPENVKHSSRYHKRCGTSFMFIVMFVSIVFFIFIRVDNTILQIVLRLLLLPVIAGVSYELIRWTGKNDNAFTRIISKPGMWFQSLTTKEPDMDMIEVAIAAVNEVFDWQSFLKDYYADAENPQAAMEAAEAELAISNSLIHLNRADNRSVKADMINDIATENSQDSFADDYVADASVEAGKVTDEKLDSVKESEALEGFDFEEEKAPIPAGVEPSVAKTPEAEAYMSSAVEAEKNEDSSEQLSAEEVEAGIMFEDVNAVPDEFADDVPLFKQRKKDKK